MVGERELKWEIFEFWNGENGGGVSVTGAVLCFNF